MNFAILSHDPMSCSFGRMKDDEKVRKQTLIDVDDLHRVDLNDDF